MTHKIKSINKIKNKKAQITIYVILAIIIVIVIILLFFLLRKREEIPIIRPSFEEPVPYIQKCVENNVEEALEIMLPKGGYIDNKDRISKLYNNKSVAYLCYTLNNYRTCVMQDPVYIKSLEQEITDYLKPKIEQCFNDLEQELKSKNYNINMRDLTISTELFSGKIRINIDRDFSITKHGETKTFRDFDTDVKSRLYDIAVIAQEIASQEAKFCNFEYQGFMVIYPDFDINKFVTSEGIKIYSVKHKKTNEELQFAIRSCAIPPGLG